MCLYPSTAFATAKRVQHVGLRSVQYQITAIDMEHIVQRWLDVLMPLVDQVLPSSKSRVQQHKRLVRILKRVQRVLKGC
jgi:hypothetical protein